MTSFFLGRCFLGLRLGLSFGRSSLFRRRGFRFLGSRLLRLGLGFVGLGFGLLRSRLLGGSHFRLFVVMVVAAAWTMHMAFLALEVGFDLRPAHRQIADLRLGEEEVDDLVLIERRTKLCRSHGVLLDVSDEGLAVLRLILGRGLAD